MPELTDYVLAYELAQWGLWCSPRKDALLAHYKAHKARKGYVEARYNQFLVRSHLGDWIRGYFAGTSYVGKISRPEKSMTARLWMELADEELARINQKG